MALVQRNTDLGFQGIDCAGIISAEVAKKLARMGISFVCRYFNWSLSAEEAKGIHDAGLALLIFYEGATDGMLKGESGGKFFGTSAVEYGAKIGVPEGTCIYFCADFDAYPRHYDKIEEYLRAATTAMKGKYRTGLYASAGVIEEMAKRKAADCFCQAASQGWNNNSMLSTYSNVYQYAAEMEQAAKNVANQIGVNVDLDTSSDLAAAGMWLPTGYSYKSGQSIYETLVNRYARDVSRLSLVKVDPTVFVPRTVAPKADEYWYRANQNPCSRMLNGTVLPNCFVGSTQFISSEGVMTLKKGFDFCSKRLLEVPTRDGEWHTASVKYFGIQDIYKVQLESSTYYCTGNHRWYILSKGKLRVVITRNLKPSMKIPYRMCNTEEFTRVVSVEDTHRREGVYCVVEPTTHSFTLSGGEITGNCVGYAHGRFSEIMGEFSPDLPICDAGNWIEEIKSKGGKLKVGDAPKLGAAAVWKKHGTKGHVAIVEYINDDGTIMLSESSYSANWNQRFFNTGPRSSPTWYNDGTYSFQGFIYNPGTEKVTHVAPYTGGTPVGTIIDKDQKSYATICAEYLLELETGAPISSSYSIQSDGFTTYLSAPLHPARRLVQAALSHLGAGSHDWVLETTDVEKNQGWSTAAVVASARQCDFSEDLIPQDKMSCSDFAKKLVERCNAEYMKGGMQGGTELPQTGDIFAMYTGEELRRYASRPDKRKYLATRIGIVREVNGDSILTVEGDIKDCILLSKHRMRDVYWYIRPDWTKEDASMECTSLLDSPIYDTLNTKEDAMLREVGYMTEDGEPSIKSNTGIRLSAINYTTTLSHVMSYYAMQNGGVIISSSTGKKYRSSNRVSITQGAFDNTWAKGTESSAEFIISYLLDKGFTLAQAVGIAGNMFVESHFSSSIIYSDPTVSNAAGICQWVGGRRTNMENFVGADWQNNLSGQLDFLMYELEGTYTHCLNSLKSVTYDTVEGAKKAADIFCRKFEVPVMGSDPDFETKMAQASAGRQCAASLIWENLSVEKSSDTKKTSVLALNKDIHTQSGMNIEVGECIEIPSWVNQSGISSNSSPYDELFSRWSRDLNQGKLADIWDKQGRKTMYTIAVVDGYLIAGCTTTLGMPGDILSVVLEDNSYFNMIVGDSKGSNAHDSPYAWEDGNAYGHYLGDKKLQLTDIIEWEAVYDGNMLKSQKARIDGLTQAQWYGKKIIKVINYGTWFR